MSNFEDNDAIQIRIEEDKKQESGAIIDVVVEEDKKEPWKSCLQSLFSKIFLVSCAIGVLVDPLFFYIPVIDEKNKCLKIDKKIRNVALILRSITDFAYGFDFLVQVRTVSSKKGKKSRWYYLLIDILAILPLPQVVFIPFFFKIASSKSIIARQYLSLLIAQYFPRIIRISLSVKGLGKEFFDPLIQRVGVRCALSLYLSLLATHVCGALWYFNAILREIVCWGNACKKQKGCVVGTFDCVRISNPTRNLTFVNEFCPVNPTHANVFDFGMYKDAIDSGILSTTDFSNKFFKCMWWGLQNLSSFGQSLNTTSNMWENISAIIICIMSIILSVCLIGFNLQTILQLAAGVESQKTSAKEKKIRSILSSYNLPKKKEKVIVKHLMETIKENKDVDVKHLFSLLEQHKSELTTKTLCKSTTERSAELWMSKNSIPCNIKEGIRQHVQLGILLEGKDNVDFINILRFLPSSLEMSVKKHLCLETLKKVPMLENMDEKVYETICNYLKPVMYLENTYIIREGEPVDLMLFVTQGIVWMFGKSSMEHIQKGDYYGKELLEWQLELKSISTFPISTRTVKSHTKVEALALTAIDLEHVLSDNWCKFSPSTHSSLDGSTLIEINSTGEFRRRIANKKS